MAVTSPFSARAWGGRFFRRPTRARPRRSASGAGDTPALSRHAVLVRWHVAGRMLDVGRIHSGLRVVCCRAAPLVCCRWRQRAAPRCPRGVGGIGGDGCEACSSVNILSGLV
jgi:hypothetical protein